MKLRCRDDTPASSARSSWREPAAGAPLAQQVTEAGAGRDVAHARTLSAARPADAEQLRVGEAGDEHALHHDPDGAGRRRGVPAGDHEREARGEPDEVADRDECARAERDARAGCGEPGEGGVDDAERADRAQEAGRQAEQVAERAGGDEVGDAGGDAGERVDAQRAAQQAVAWPGGGSRVGRRECVCLSAHVILRSSG